MVEYIVLSIGAMRRSAAKGGADPATVQQMGEAGAALLAAFEHNLTSKSEEQMPIRAVMMDAPVSVVPMFRGQMARRNRSSSLLIWQSESTR